MLKLGWTEKQLKEENTVMKLRQIQAYLEQESKAERARQVHVPDPRLNLQSKGQMG